MSEPSNPPPAMPRWATAVVIPTLWTPEQALAVFELLDDLREKVATLYAADIQTQLRKLQGHGDDAAATAAGGDDDPGNDRPF